MNSSDGTQPTHEQEYRLPAYLLPTGLCVAILIVCGIGWWGGQGQARLADTEMRRSLLQQATTLANSISIQGARTMMASPESADQTSHRESSRQKRALIDQIPDRIVYSLFKQGDQLRFGPDFQSDVTTPPFPPRIVYQRPPPQSHEAFESGKAVVFGPHEDEYGRFITALAPVIDPATNESLMLIGVEMTAADWKRQLQDARRPSTLRSGVVALVLLLGGLLLWYRGRASTSVQYRLRNVELILIALYTIVFAWAIGDRINEMEQRERESTLTSMAEGQIALLRDGISRLTISVDLFSRYFQSSEYISADEFDRMTDSLLNHPDVLAIGWIPLNEQSPQAERGQPQYVHTDQQIPELARSNHVAAPFLGRAITNTIANGRDMALVPLPASHVPSLDARTTYVAYRAVRQSNDHDQLMGVIFVLFDLQTLLQHTIEQGAFSSSAFYVHLRDPTSKEGTRAANYPGVTDNHTHETNDWQAAFYHQPLLVFNRVFLFSAYPERAFTTVYPTQSGLIVFLAGLLLAAILTTFTAVMRFRYGSHRQAQSEERYRQLFNAMTSGIAVHELLVDEQGQPVDYRFLEVNRAFEEHTGLTADELVGRTLYEVLPDSEPYWLQRYAPVALSGQSIHFEHFDYVRNRHYDILAYSPAPRQFATLITDISKRKRTEELLAQNQVFRHILMDMATRFINLPVEQIESATLHALEEIGRFTGSDRAYQFAYDFEKGTMTNTLEWCDEEIEPQIDHLQQVPLSKDDEWCAAHKEGVPYVVEDTFALPPDSNVRRTLEPQGIKSMITIPLMSGNDCIGFIGFDACREKRVWREHQVGLLRVLAQLLVSAHLRKQAEEERVELEGQMQRTQKLESLGILAGGIAHDFNNILTAIMGNAELALMETPSDGNIAEYLEDVVTGSKRAADLCRQMLAYAGKSRLVVQTFSLNELIEDMTNLLKASISKSARFHIELDKDLPRIEGDHAQIQQILLNLCINASEALGDSGGSITVQTRSVDLDAEELEERQLASEIEPGFYVALEVSDTGCGMDEETKARIFDPFFTTKFTGRGLGLSAVMGIVHSHHGALQVNSERNKGTTFTLFLPASPYASTEGAQAAEPAAKPWEGSGTLLLVDDEDSLRMLGSRVVRRLGFEVVTAEDGVDALAKYHTHKESISVVLLDLTMPRMNGIETLNELRQLDSSLPVILASGYSEESLSTSDMLSDPSAFIQKPFTLHQLRQTLIRVFNGDEADAET